MSATVHYEFSYPRERRKALLVDATLRFESANCGTVQWSVDALKTGENVSPDQRSMIEVWLRQERWAQIEHKFKTAMAVKGIH